MDDFIDKALSKNFDRYFDFLNKKMIEEQLIKRGISDKRLLEAFSKIKRHFFLPEALWSRAYDDYAMEIYPGQSISQPYITAYMIEKLRLSGTEKVLEIGTGSGYQTALLCQLAREVYSIDIKENLKSSAEKNLKSLGFSNFTLITGDGKKGFEDKAPYERIIISCAAAELPECFISQLSENGIIIAPVGEKGQELTLIEKSPQGLKTEKTLKVNFVPML
ncbi:MAG: protein-L-isoaspartate(D-aspartate) O-methyltransferase [Elusimicrobiota bacterium]